ncbi:MAG: glycosyltransferase [Methanobrevibacter sp.]|nr:glycosyltransferase [Candidatus Saccharibacteria bacterium]MBQ3476452.1 glycosyltransferase [Candidatus Saccharibacteria bacterium]MBQ6351344.1 glycosyltransferase [Methanobrevibacter sp.]MBR0371505.1 glycosyltransferase [Methanobrevibacter sp.]
MDKIAVLIPCYNEAKTIRKVVTDWKKALPKAVIYVYDNNSSDGSDEIAKKAGAIVRYVKQQGKGNVIRKMFREVDAQCYIMIDGDDTYPADSSKELIDAVFSDGADMVVGDRLSSTYFKENKRPFHNIGNTAVRWAINTFFRSDIKDIMTGCRAFNYQFVKSFPVLSQGFEVETEMSIWAIDKNMLVKSIPINYRDRPKGSDSKLNTYSDGFKVIMMIIRLFRNYRPMAFFGIIAFLLTLVATVFFIPILIEYINTGLVPNFPTLIVCGFVFLTAIQAFFAGLILKTLRQKDRQDFEQRLIDIRNKK